MLIAGQYRSTEGYEHLAFIKDVVKPLKPKCWTRTQVILHVLGLVSLC